MSRAPFPGTITAIEPQAKTRKYMGVRVNVFIDDKFSFAIDAELARRRELHVGVTIGAAALEQLLGEDGDAKAYARALHFLSFRIRAAQEIRERLKRDGWPEEVIERTIARLHNEKLVNDAHFAAAWVENRSLTRPRGARLLQQELRQKGVAKDEIQAALPEADEELENALVAARPKLRLWAKYDERERRQKLIEFLLRRGFAFSTAREAAKRIEEDE